MIRHGDHDRVLATQAPSRVAREPTHHGPRRRVEAAEPGRRVLEPVDPVFGIARERHGHGASHHEGEARIPGARDIQEVLDLLGIRHPREREPGAEEDTREERDELPHGLTPSR